MKSKGEVFGQYEPGIDIDTSKLMRRLKGRKTTLVRIEDLTVHWWPECSKERLLQARTQWPVIIDKNNTVINGAHRILKLIIRRERFVEAIRATASDLRACYFKSE